MIPYNCIRKWPSILLKEEKKRKLFKLSWVFRWKCWVLLEFSDVGDITMRWYSNVAFISSVNKPHNMIMAWYRRCCNVLRFVATFSVLEVLFQRRVDGYKSWWFDVIHFLVKSLSYLQKIQIYKVCMEFTLIEVVHSYFLGRSRRN